MMHFNAVEVALAIALCDPVPGRDQSHPLSRLALFSDGFSEKRAAERGKELGYACELMDEQPAASRWLEDAMIRCSATATMLARAHPGGSSSKKEQRGDRLDEAAAAAGACDRDRCAVGRLRALTAALEPCPGATARGDAQPRRLAVALELSSVLISLVRADEPSAHPFDVAEDGGRATRALVRLFAAEGRAGPALQVLLDLQGALLLEAVGRAVRAPPVPAKGQRLGQPEFEAALPVLRLAAEVSRCSGALASRALHAAIEVTYGHFRLFHLGRAPTNVLPALASLHNEAQATNPRAHSKSLSIAYALLSFALDLITSLRTVWDSGPDQQTTLLPSWAAKVKAMNIHATRQMEASKQDPFFDYIGQVAKWLAKL